MPLPPLTDPLPSISLIVPSWRDDSLIREKAWVWAALPYVCEVIIVTASPQTDLSANGRVKVIVSPVANRGLQMNLGADNAIGDILLFQHADSELTAPHLAAVAEKMSRPEIIGGAFHRAFDERHPAFRWISHFERWRNLRSGSLFGDQSIFVRTANFRAMHGYRDFPLMEDMEFSRRLRRAGEIVLLDPPMRSSARRHLARGAYKTSLQNALFILLYHFGVSPATLHRWYYSQKTSS